MEESPDGLLPFHEHGHKTMSDRFHQLQLTIDAIPGMKLLNFFNSTGGYAWIHCGPLTCQEEFDSVNLTGIKGSSFGGTDQGKARLIVHISDGFLFCKETLFIWSNCFLI